MELSKKCMVCGHEMELIAAPPTQPLQPEHRWQCTCGAWEALYGRKEEGEV